MKTTNLRYDLPASVVVFFIAVPLCLGSSLASGAPLFSGLIAGFVGGLVVGALSGSPLGVSGPAAGLAVIVLHAIEDLGFDAFLMAVVIGGAFQLLLCAFRAGVLGYFFPSSVIRGMLAGIGLIIFLKQIPHAFGYDKDPEGEMQFVQPDGETTFSELAQVFERVEWNAFFVAAVALLILLFWDNVLAKLGGFFRIVQGPLVAVAFGIAYQVVTLRFFPDHALSSEHLVNVPVSSDVESFIGLFQQPDWSSIGSWQVWITGGTLAIVGSLETLLCLEATDRLDPQKRVTPPNRELFAQGIGNMVSGAIGGLPVTQVIVRSSANIQSGAKTKFSAIGHGAWLLVAIIALPKLLNMVPLAVLASILFVVGYKLARPSLFVEMARRGFPQFMPFLVTIAGILLTDLLTGICLGLGAAILVILRRNYANSHFLHIEQDTTTGNRVLRLKLSEEVSFLNKGALLRELSGISSGTIVHVDMSSCYWVDHDVMEILNDFKASGPERGIEVELVGEPERERLI